MVTYLGRHILILTDTVQNFFFYFLQVIYSALTPPFRIKDTLRQIHTIANQSIFMISFCVTFAAIVTIMESSFHMKLVIHNDSMVPAFAAMLILRELGAVVMALLLTSKIGAGIAAEVGSMTVTEQVDALKMLGIDPIRYLVVPRLIACLISGAILSIIANLVCLTGAMIVSSIKLGHTTESFISIARHFVEFKDLIFATIKGAVFGAVIPIISCYYGFRCKTGAEGVGLATTNSVVTATINIIFLDFLLSWFFTNFY